MSLLPEFSIGERAGIFNLGKTVKLYVCVELLGIRDNKAGCFKELTFGSPAA